MGAAIENWAGNIVFEARALARPSHLDELQQLVAAATADERRLHAVGSRHSFNRIADAADLLVDVSALDTSIELDGEHVWCGAGRRYADLANELQRRGRALHNLPSLPHVTVGGAVATATHGSGRTNACLAAAVDAVEMVTAAGELVTIERGDVNFGGAVVALGALGVVTRLRLRTEPTFDVEQTVYRALPITTAIDHLDEIMSSAYSVSLFTDWRSMVDQVWVKRRVDRDDPPPSTLFGAVPATADVHPLAGLDPAACTPQCAVAGPWHERLPHFRAAFTPSHGDELQSEYFVGIDAAAPAMRALVAIGAELEPVLLVSEVRTIAADDQWISTSSDADKLAVHFTWRRDPTAVAAVLPTIEAALAPFGARPHWAKVSAMSVGDVRCRFPRFEDFRRLVERLDPTHTFRNAVLEELLADPAA